MLITAGMTLVCLVLFPGFAKGETTDLGEYGPFERIWNLTGTLEGSAWGF